MTQKNNPTDQTQQPKVFDVARPGAARPTTSSRPIIVTHRPMVQDPMVTKEHRDDADMAAKTAPPLPTTQTVEPSQPKPVTISTVDADDQAQSQQPHEQTQKSDEPVTVTVAAAGTTIETTTPPLPDSEKKQQPSETQSLHDKDNSPSGISDAPETHASPDSPETTSISEAEQTSTPQEKSTPDVDALFQDDDHNTDLQARVLHDLKDITFQESAPSMTEGTHFGHAIALCVIILVIVLVVCLDVLLDAGALTIPGIPHTTFINTYQP